MPCGPVLWVVEVTYAHEEIKFSGPRTGPAHAVRTMPNMKSLFHKFFTPMYLRKICKETNHYVASIDPETQSTRGPHDWWKLGVNELEAWLGICMLMGIKVLLHWRGYWMKSQLFFYSLQIASVMYTRRFEAIGKCLHIKDDSRTPTN